MTARYAVREPRQERTRVAWQRILDAGVAVLEDEGAGGFTIDAICARASVVPRAVYDRVDTKEALFYAVYEHGMQRVQHTEGHLEAIAHQDVPPAARIHATVQALAQAFVDNERFLRAVVLVSSQDPEIERRGVQYVARLSARFAAALHPARPAMRHSDPDAAIRWIFGDLFAALTLRTAYGPTFFGPAHTDGQHLEHLCALARAFLL
ncbi:putative TetR family transcriptional regulator [Nostocoides australiense Ben110]|uniref:Putative TetR family transcriptional regulator n=1 Tax=Nostocoides australiense Ben110 TaxID=1193182 RepID=W6K0I4_9MICO|nr:TetR/AcrR family transcriptional regulator [Tetrasphaera australiensis]CCH74957.1 putative TetR family transcriptional regulator [Tetrasphaera australiensis Ben110]